MNAPRQRKQKVSTDHIVTDCSTMPQRFFCKHCGEFSAINLPMSIDEFVKRGNFELTKDMGAAIARFVSRERVPTVIDMSLMRSKSDWRSVVADFCNELFDINERPVHIAVEEAPEFIPQRIFDNVAGVYSAMDRLIRIGRNHGIGITVIAQRPQMINKDSLSQVNALLVMRLSDPHSIDNINDWLSAQGADSDLTDDFIRALPTLQDGQGLILSPAWLKTFDIVQFNRRETFHYDPEADDESAQVADNIARVFDASQLEKLFGKYMNTAGRNTTQLVNKSDKADAAMHKRMTELEQRNAELETALEELQQNAVTEDEVQRRTKMAEQAATREVTAQMNQIRATIAQVLPMLQGLVGTDPETGKPAIVAPMNKLLKLQRQIEEHTRLKPAHKRVMQVLFDEYPDFPNGMSQVKLASALSMKLESLQKNLLPELRSRKYIITQGSTVAINPEML